MSGKSWLDVGPESHFPLQNLPYGVFSSASDSRPRIGVAIGDRILDLNAASKVPLLAKTEASKAGAFQQETLNAFMSLGKDAWKEARAAIMQILRSDESTLRDNTALQKSVLVLQKEATMHLPVEVGDYTDFYACMEHARNGSGVKTGFRVLAPNWVHLPVAYHGRSSSVVVSGESVRRPWGQALASPKSSNALWSFLQGWWSMAQPVPEERPSAALDFELEMACLIGIGNRKGDSISVDAAGDHIFGLVLMNDWSARDFQGWEMLPLGPFNSKNFATQVSPWIVPLEALEPFRRPAPEQTPAVLPYLKSSQQRTLFDIHLEASVQPKGGSATTITKTNFQQLYWSLEQMIAHHTLGSCNLRPGDMLGTGTISSPGPNGQGSLMELSWGASKQVQLSGGETRTYLQDGDTVTLSGFCQGEGYKIGFGECTGTVLPASQR